MKLSTSPKILMRCLLTGLLSGLVGGCTNSTPNSTAGPADKPFLIIAHRGASGYRPEHTLAAYQLAINQGADYIEPDLVPTRDGHLIARHENALALVELPASEDLRSLQSRGKLTVLSATTDVAERPEFAHLLREREIDGRKVAGWFSEDFSLAQIKTLWAKERIPELRQANTHYTRERIPSLQDVLALTRQAGNTHIGLYPELKHPTHFRFGRRSPDGPTINIDTAGLLVAALKESDYAKQQPMYIQCFEVETLRRLRHGLLENNTMASRNIKLVQLFGPMSATPPDVAYHKRNSSSAEFSRVYGPLQDLLEASPNYASIAGALPMLANDYANGVGPRKGDAKKLAWHSKALGLELHPYTVRAEAFFLSPLRGGLARTVEAELTTLQALGATGVFVDQPDLAVSWRDQQTASTP